MIQRKVFRFPNKTIKSAHCHLVQTGSELLQCLTKDKKNQYDIILSYKCFITNEGFSATSNT